MKWLPSDLTLPVSLSCDLCSDRDTLEAEVDAWGWASGALTSSLRVPTYWQKKKKRKSQCPSTWTIQETYKTTIRKRLRNLCLALEVVYISQGPVIEARLITQEIERTQLLLECLNIVDALGKGPYSTPPYSTQYALWSIAASTQRRPNCCCIVDCRLHICICIFMQISSWLNPPIIFCNINTWGKIKIFCLHRVRGLPLLLLPPCNVENVINCCNLTTSKSHIISPILFLYFYFIFNDKTSQENIEKYLNYTRCYIWSSLQNFKKDFNN